MFKKTLAFMTAFAAAACMFVSCGKPKLEGKYELCTKDGMGLDVTLSFKDEGRMKINDERCKYELIDDDTIEISETDEKYFSDIFDFKIIDQKKKLIYIEDVSERYESWDLNAKASQFYKALNSAAADFDDEDRWMEDGILCSDEKKIIIDMDIENMDISLAEIEKKASRYLEDENFFENYDYMFYVKDGVCDAAIISRKGGSFAGSYPPCKVINIKTGDTYCSYKVADKVTLDEYYENYKSQIK